MVKSLLMTSLFLVMGCATAPHSTEYELIDRVNNQVNEYPYVSDEENYGKDDHLATTEEFYAKGGDCEDYAMTKYAVLLHEGIPLHNMHFIIATDGWTGAKHAFLQVKTSEGEYILDNDFDRPVPVKWHLKDFTDIHYYNPVYVRKLWYKLSTL